MSKRNPACERAVGEYWHVLLATEPRAPINQTHIILRRLYQTHGDIAVNFWLAVESLRESGSVAVLGALGHLVQLVRFDLTTLETATDAVQELKG